jgi:hypothetical protein
MRNLYNCPFCNQQSTRRWNLDIHIKRRHGGIGQPIAKVTHAPLQSPGKLMSNNWHTNDQILRGAGGIILKAGADSITVPLQQQALKEAAAK